MKPQLETQKLFQVFVPGKPYAQSRPRTVMKGGRSHTYSNASKGLKNWKKQIRDCVSAATRSTQVKSVEGAVFVDMVFMIPIKAKKRWGCVSYTKPDKDNLEKAVLDVLEECKLFDVGDSQVGAGEVVKLWCRYGQEGVFLEFGRVRAIEKKEAPHGAPLAPEWLAG